MSVAVSCPEAQVLQRFSLGQMSSGEVEALAGHVASCQRCIQTLDSLHLNDTLIEAIAARQRADNRDQTEPVQALMGRLKANRFAAAVSKDAPTQTNMGDSVAGQAEGLNTLQFLSPPQQPDEIGRLGAYRIL